VFKVFKSFIAVGIRMQVEPTEETAESNDTVKQTAGS